MDILMGSRFDPLLNCLTDKVYFFKGTNSNVAIIKDVAFEIIINLDLPSLDIL